MSKKSFKALVKESCHNASFTSLIKEKDSRSKGREIKYESLKTQGYLLPENGLNVEQMRRIYHVRCREIDLKANFPSASADSICPSSECSSEDSQSHLFKSKCFSENNEIMNNNIVHYEKTNFKKGASVTATTRFVDLELEEGKSLLNYFWMAGPLAKDKGRRIVVLHSNQSPQ